MIALWCLADYHDGIFHVETLPVRIISFLVIGVAVSLITWWLNQISYKGQLPPDDVA